MVKLMVDLRAWAIVIAVAALIVGLAKHGDGCACRLHIPVLKKRRKVMEHGLNFDRSNICDVYYSYFLCSCVDLLLFWAF